jgi:hypothetical protein
METLTGSEKQITWATEIRENLVAAAGSWIAKLECTEAPAGKEAEMATTMATLRKVAAKLESEATAKWFIDHRGLIQGPLSEANMVSAKNAVVKIAREL